VSVLAGRYTSGKVLELVSGPFSELGVNVWTAPLMLVT
jgi:hypothetical protein